MFVSTEAWKGPFEVGEQMRFAMPKRTFPSKFEEALASSSPKRGFS
jgi:hypothetical protein